MNKLEEVRIKLNSPLADIVEVIRNTSRAKDINKEEIRELKNYVIHAVKTADK